MTLTNKMQSDYKQMDRGVHMVASSRPARGTAVRRIGKTPTIFRSLEVLALALAMTACQGGNESGSVDETVSAAAVTLTGSVGDGPVAGADITIVDAKGNVVLQGTSDSTANYQIEVPPGTLFPVVIKASGGTDLVSGQPVDFEVRAVAFDPTETLVNISPLSTLAVKTASCSSDGLTPKRLNKIWDLLSTRLNMGIDPAAIAHPMYDAITPDT